jgi:hypothetical protein
MGNNCTGAVAAFYQFGTPLVLQLFQSLVCFNDNLGAKISGRSLGKTSSLPYDATVIVIRNIDLTNQHIVAILMSPVLQ